MGHETSRVLGSSGQTILRGETSFAASRNELAGQFAWEIVAISVHLHDIRNFLASAIGVSGPQWNILIALSELDRGEGVPVKTVAGMLQVEPSFVSTQSKTLEKKGFLRRKTSGGDARVVQMSLTDKSCKRIAGLASLQEELNNLIFGHFNDRELKEFISALTTVKSQLEKARLKIAIDI